MCDCLKHADDSAFCSCICPEHKNFDLALEIADSRYEVISNLRNTIANLREEKDVWRRAAIRNSETIEQLSIKLDRGNSDDLTCKHPQIGFDKYMTNGVICTRCKNKIFYISDIQFADLVENGRDSETYDSFAKGKP